MVTEVIELAGNVNEQTTPYGERGWPHTPRSAVTSLGLV
jgi:hypothetical protein